MPIRREQCKRALPVATRSLAVVVEADKGEVEDVMVVEGDTRRVQGTGTTQALIKLRTPALHRKEDSAVTNAADWGTEHQCAPVRQLHRVSEEAIAGDVSAAEAGDVKPGTRAWLLMQVMQGRQAPQLPPLCRQ
jgi:hypothetical protein